MAVSGAGNVAIYTAEKLLEFGATVLTMSDSSGYVYFEKGITREQLTAVDTHKVANRGRLSDFKEGEVPCSWQFASVASFPQVMTAGHLITLALPLTRAACSALSKVRVCYEIYSTPAEKVLKADATVLTMSDSSGYVHFKKAITREQPSAMDTHEVANKKVVMARFSSL